MSFKKYHTMYPSSFTYQGTLTIYRNADRQIAVLKNVPFEEVEYRFRKRVRAFLRHQKSARMNSLEGFFYKYVRELSDLTGVDYRNN